MEWWRLEVRNRRAAVIFVKGVIWLGTIMLCIMLPAVVVTLFTFVPIHNRVVSYWKHRFALFIAFVLSLGVMAIALVFLVETLFLVWGEGLSFSKWLYYAATSTVLLVGYEILFSVADALIPDSIREAKKVCE